jgi:hypothetical protein
MKYKYLRHRKFTTISVGLVRLFSVDLRRCLARTLSEAFVFINKIGNLCTLAPPPPILGG